MADDSRRAILEPLTREALLEVTRDDTIGDLLDIVDEGEGVSTVTYSNTLPGYPGWVWTVSVATVEGAEPTVLETELLPGESSLLAPDWVPWVERLAEYEASQEAAGALAAEGESDDDESDDDDDESDDDDDADEDDDFEDEDDDESDDEDEDDEPDDDLGDDEFDGVDVEEAAEAGGLDEPGRR
ncbi:hypothetical protein AS850_02550 [Frondihabitans sp. 762G35]|uniref:DUF3027 domain-containing protein n=1 Tax=Frondihabitans sp. 762G35 TaxID=1446794 RepID=UPI000D20176C|nr:DUF3027 domain-containing protein [Frondihabitans sp. 762G35]ARC55953.1 hypothetical protein AS850_02550 [Frondihabitans sp. 762G35]